MIFFVTKMYKILCKIGLLVKISQVTETGLYDYNVISVVLLTELCKLLISLLLFCKDNPIRSIIDKTKENSTLLFLYMIPAFLYCFYNNLAFINLSIFDPTTYFILLQLRVLLTGIVYQCLFQKKLSNIQWLSLVLLTIGCILKELKVDDNVKKHSYGLVTGMVLMATQIFCSCLAGVYNEYLLKNDRGSKVNVYVQNMFMYADSIVCNLILWLTMSQHTQTAKSLDSSSINFWAILIVLNSAAYGIVTSLLLHSLNSIMKVFATAVELVLIALLSWIILSYPITWQTAVGVCIVSFSVVIYAKHPITKNGQKSKPINTNSSSDTVV
ncbi:UDP-galactose transporter senju isoform X2 [Adelges cooleyi]|uniref:UDP-galactose transporter senju isoform X2 n=1 Tax=Adelges cooleyi TaxID=133065 RepID=UPI00217FF8BC|nr:UDP-galactose transporter senju isoform X2 [Adelges cooleyi]